MTIASLDTPPWLDIWVEAGREGQVFTYANTLGLELGVGDLVRVRLNGRPHSGLVVGLPGQLPPGLSAEALRPIEAVLEAAAVDASWRQLIEAVAQQCHTSSFLTLRSALPPGWLGSRSQPKAIRQRIHWQLALIQDPAPGEAAFQRLGERQRALLEILQARGGQAPMRELFQQEGINQAVVKGLERRGLVVRQALAEGGPTGPVLAKGEAGQRLTPPPGRGGGGNRRRRRRRKPPALGGDRCGQDRGLPAGSCPQLGRGPQRAAAHTGDRPGATAPRPLQEPFWPGGVGVAQRRG